MNLTTSKGLKRAQVEINPVDCDYLEPVVDVGQDSPLLAAAATLEGDNVKELKYSLLMRALHES